MKEELMNILLREDGSLIEARLKAYKTGRKIWFELNYPDLYYKVISSSGKTLTEKLYKLLVSDDVIVCEWCKKEQTKFHSYSKGYYRFCSNRCQNEWRKSLVDETKRRENAKKAIANWDDEKWNRLKNKAKKTVLERYGVDNIAKLTETKEKMISTCYEKYNAPWAMQNRNIAEKSLRNGAGRSKIRWYNESIWYQGINEFKFLQKYYDTTNISRGPYFRFSFLGSLYSYHSDFIIDKTIYEIKSRWTWDKKGKDRNLKKINKLKLRTIKQYGYTPILVLDGKEYTYQQVLKL